MGSTWMGDHSRIGCEQQILQNPSSRDMGPSVQGPTDGWSDLHFLRFSKIDILLSISYIFMSSITKNWQKKHRDL